MTDRQPSNLIRTVDRLLITLTMAVWSDAPAAVGSVLRLDPTSGSIYTAARGIGVDSGGNVYVCGEASSKGGSLRWIVRKLSTGGAWTKVSELSGQGDASAKGICFFPGRSATAPPLT
jgi:hypothetical protein